MHCNINDLGVQIEATKYILIVHELISFNAIAKDIKRRYVFFKVCMGSDLQNSITTKQDNLTNGKAESFYKSANQKK